MSKIYCGIGKVPKGSKRGSMKECVESGQIRYYGIKKIDPKLQGQVIDGGLNCASGNEICDGVHFANHQCIPLSGTCHSSDI